jgi:PadR family transcriptional regulator, regulatory protein PadR
MGRARRGVEDPGAVIVGPLATAILGTVPAGRRRPRGLVPACLLLLLDDAPSHGYELIDRLGALGLSDSACRAVYRQLRSLEVVGVVSAEIETRATGPSRKVYRLTPAGRDVLAHGAGPADDLVDTLEALLDRRRLAGREQEP